jgi:hypothetical protein
MEDCVRTRKGAGIAKHICSVVGPVSPCRDEGKYFERKRMRLIEDLLEVSLLDPTTVGDLALLSATTYHILGGT